MNRVQKQFVKDALDQPEKLTDWEYDYINDLAGKPDEYVLSQKQNEILNRIQRKLD
jgi:hypothetical protein